MNIDGYKERSLEVGRDLHSLLDDMYAAIDDEASLDEVNQLLDRANKKIEEYENLYSDSSEVWREGMKKKYLSEIEKAREFINQLKEKYPDSH